MSKEIIVERGTKTVYRDGDTIVKQFKAGYPKSAVIKEAFNHALAEEVGLNVPELLEVKDTGEGWALVIRNIPGKTMAQLMQERPENIDSLMEQFVDIQSDIQLRKPFGFHTQLVLLRERLSKLLLCGLHL